MVCATKFPPPGTPVYEPSPQHIQQMTAAIRKAWSPKVRASRVVQGRDRVEVMEVSARALFSGRLDDRR